MKLKLLIKGIKDLVVKGSKEIDISGITSNSKMVSPGNLFVAKRGRTSDGNAYIPEALRAGSAAILTDIFDPSLRDVTQLISLKVLDVEAELACNYFQSPSEELCMVGVTGTSGKTTTTYAIKHILDNLGTKPGLIGTIEYDVGSNRYQASKTTPDVIMNQKLLREMVRSGCQSCVMEVSSHALDQKRVMNIEFDIAVFTNLTHEHLDYHKTMEEYFEAKKKLFSALSKKKLSKKRDVLKVAICNMDSPWLEKLLDNCPAEILTYGIENPAQIRASNITFTSNGTTFTVQYKDEVVSFSWPLVGRFNVYNALAAIGVGLTMGLCLYEIAPILSTFQSAPGRLERVNNPLGLNIYVDYAHKVDALKNVLVTLRECLQEKGKGKIITLFGCGGDRDREKRPLMARAAEELSDVVIITSDNPRSEDPEAIAREIISGFLNKEAHLVELDRKNAICKAIDLATADDILLIAGKGHETKQQFHHMIIDFDDRLVAKEYSEQKAYLEQKA